MLKLVVPISAPNADGVLLLARHAQSGGADLVEIRLDACVAAGADPRAIISTLTSLPIPAILTIRHTSEQGEAEISDTDRVTFFHEGMKLGVAYIDIELAQLSVLVAQGFKRTDSTQLILSYHDFDGMGDDLSGRIAQMRTAGADIAKVAVRANDASDLATIKALYDDATGPLVAIAMGEHGLPSRLLAGCWGAALTFARLDGDVGSAPGQPSLNDMRRLYRCHQQSAKTAIYGVIGSPVSHSLSPVMHNVAFAHHGIDAVYVPFRVEDAVAFWRACQEWIAGLSITIPHKPSLIGQMHSIEDLAQRIGAINTVYRDRDLKPVGANTDALAVLHCLEEQLGELKNREVIVLGAGGVARAIALAVGDRGARVTIVNRTEEKARELAAETGATYRTFEEALEVPFDVLVNGTSAGMGKPDESPWPSDRHREGSVVFDTVYHPLETKLLRDAQMAEARTVSGLEMLIQQALGQYQRWTGREAPRHVMHRACLDRLGGTHM